MLALLLALLIFATLMVFAIGSITWAIREHVLANRYRQLCRMHPANNAADGVVHARRPDATMKTYVMWNGIRMKIGRSEDPERYLKELEATIAAATGTPSTLKLLVVFNGDIERELRQGFASSGAGGEWFDCSEEVRDLLNLFFKTHDGLTWTKPPRDSSSS
jgi:hypothetical protein